MSAFHLTINHATKSTHKSSIYHYILLIENLRLDGQGKEFLKSGRRKVEGKKEDAQHIYLKKKESGIKDDKIRERLLELVDDKDLDESVK